MFLCVPLSCRCSLVTHFQRNDGNLFWPLLFFHSEIKVAAGATMRILKESMCGTHRHKEIFLLRNSPERWRGNAIPSRSWCRRAGLSSYGFYKLRNAWHQDPVWTFARCCFSVVASLQIKPVNHLWRAGLYLLRFTHSSKTTEYALNTTLTRQEACMATLVLKMIVSVVAYAFHKECLSTAWLIPDVCVCVSV